MHFQKSGARDWSGAAVLVRANGRVLFERGYGLATFEHRAAGHSRNEISNRFLITKQFHRRGDLKLRKEGRVSLDDKLSKFLPEFRAAMKSRFIIC